MGSEMCIRDSGMSDRIEHATIQLNHYQCKTFSEFQARMRRGDANVPEDHPSKKRDGSLARFSQLDQNEERDDAISRFFGQFDLEMAKIKDALAGVQ